MKQIIILNGLRFLRRVYFFAFLFSCQIFLCIPLIKTLVISLRGYMDNPGLSPIKILNLITYVNSLLLCKLIPTGSRDSGMDIVHEVHIQAQPSRRNGEQLSKAPFLSTSSLALTSIVTSTSSGPS